MTSNFDLYLASGKTVEEALRLDARQNGFVHFDTSPKGASIYIDGQIQINPQTEESIKTPATISMIEGRRDFKLVLEGHQEVSGYVDVYPGRTVNISRNLVPIKSSSNYSTSLKLTIEPAKILIIRTMKTNDPTEYTFSWGEEAVRFAKSLGYQVMDIQKDNVNYQYVTEAIKKYQPRLTAFFGHGCMSSLQGQRECCITRRYTLDQLIELATNDIDKFNELFAPLQEQCKGVCRLNNDVCSPLCDKETNINLLKGSIVLAYACYSASQLGICAIKYGVQTYVGYSDLLMFPTDQMRSQDLFGHVQLTLFKSLLMGKSVREAEEDMIKLEDEYIRYFKKTKYIALPLLWNKRARILIGEDARIYE